MAARRTGPARRRSAAPAVPSQPRLLASGTRVTSAEARDLKAAVPGVDVSVDDGK